jgi:hypothetical protein
MDDAARLWLEGLTVTLIAKRLAASKHRVYFLLRVLQLKDTRVRRPVRPGTHVYSMRVPAFEEESDAA